MQPWHFAITTEPETKTQIKIAAETEEKPFTPSAHLMSG
jgi:hypothetical protein